MWHTWECLLVTVCLAALIGCDKGNGKGADASSSARGSSDTRPATSTAPRGPRETLAALWRVMGRGDGQLAAAFYDASADEKTFIVATAPLILNVRAFCEAGKRAYGEAAWAAMVGRSRAAFLNKPLIPDADAMADKITCEIEGDQATCRVEGMPTWRLVRKDGVWRVTTHDLPAKKGRDHILKNLAGVAKAIDEASATMGQPGVTAKQVIGEFIHAMERIAVTEVKPGASRPAPPN